MTDHNSRQVCETWAQNDKPCSDINPCRSCLDRAYERARLPKPYCSHQDCAFPINCRQTHVTSGRN